MILLAVETGGRRGGAAVFEDGRLVGVRRLSTERRRASELAAAVDALFRELDRRPAEVGVVAVSIGPGSFTGLRIGVTFAKTFALATGAKAVAVPSLEVIAHNAPAAADAVAVVLDAKRGQVFTGLFGRTDGAARGPGEVRPDSAASSEGGARSDGGPGIPVRPRQKLRPDRVCTPAELLAELPRPATVLGEGLRVHGAALTAAGVAHLGEEHWDADPVVVGRLALESVAAGRFVEADALVPMYLRRPEAEDVWAKRYGEKAEG
jgi:tRNA threonylcarbamoyladenosine biosynthesis protein TsaB